MSRWFVGVIAQSPFQPSSKVAQAAPAGTSTGMAIHSPWPMVPRNAPAARGFGSAVTRA